MLTRLGLSLVLGALVLSGQSSFGIVTANGVVDYDPGAGAKNAYWGAPLDNATSALGFPSAKHDVPNIFDGDDLIAYSDQSVTSPFNGAYAPDEIVTFGAGGHITLHLSAPVSTAGVNLGVHTGVALADQFSPAAGQNYSTAFAYTDPRVATVEISADGSNWFSLGQKDFSAPTNYYSAGLATPYDYSAGTRIADFSVPFVHPVSDFDGLDWAGTVDLFGGSGGGTWLDLSTATGVGALPKDVQFVRFSLPAGSSDAFVLDAVTAIAATPVMGDANGDGVVDADDYVLVDRGFAKHLNAWFNGDFNGDGTVDAADYLLIDTTYGEANGLEASLLSERRAEFGEGYVDALVNAVPEPSMVAVMALMTLVVGRRRR